MEGEKVYGSDLTELQADQGLTEFEIEHNGKWYRFGMRGLTGAVKNQALSTAVTYTKGGAKFDMDIYARNIISKRVVALQPQWNINPMTLASLEADFFDKLQAEAVPIPYDLLNNEEAEELKNV